MRSAALLTLLGLLATAQAASNQAANLRDLKDADLCPPAAYVTLDDKSDDALAADLEGQLDKYATLYGLQYGDPKTCLASPFLSVDAFKTSRGNYSYIIEFGVELEGDAQLSVGGRSFAVNTPKIWSNLYYGVYSSLSDLKGGVADKVRDYFDEFALDWRASHR